MAALAREAVSRVQILRQVEIGPKRFVVDVGFGAQVLVTGSSNAVSK